MLVHEFRNFFKEFQAFRKWILNSSSLSTCYSKHKLQAPHLINEISETNYKGKMEKRRKVKNMIAFSLSKRLSLTKQTNKKKQKLIVKSKIIKLFIYKSKRK
jgi:hypothetical protein